MPFLCGQDRRDRPTQDPNEGKKSPPKPKPEPEPAIPEGRCNLHPTGRHKAKDCPGLTNTARFSGYLGPASQGDAQPGVAPLEPREDPPEDDQPGDQEYCQLVGCSLTCCLGPLDGHRHQFQHFSNNVGHAWFPFFQKDCNIQPFCFLIKSVLLQREHTLQACLEV